MHTFTYIYIYTPWKFKKWTRSVFSKWDHLKYIGRTLLEKANDFCWSFMFLFFLQGHSIVCRLIGCQSRQPWQISDLHLKHWSAAWPFADGKLSSYCNYIGNYRDYNKPWKKDPEINQSDPISISWNNMPRLLLPLLLECSSHWNSFLVPSGKTSVRFQPANLTSVPAAGSSIFPVLGFKPVTTWQPFTSRIDVRVSLAPICSMCLLHRVCWENVFCRLYNQPGKLRACEKMQGRHGDSRNLFGGNVYWMAGIVNRCYFTERIQRFLAKMLASPR